MLKRLVCLVLMMSMILHCASRLGLLSFLYKNRHDIAYTIGLIAEVPIAICSSDYHFDQELMIQDAGDDDELPLNLTQIQEIILFAPATVFVFSVERSSREDKARSAYRPTDSSLSIPDIFHPPSRG